MTSVDTAAPRVPDQLAPAVSHLTKRFAGTVGPETVARLVVESHQELAADARIDTFLPLLAQHLAADRLCATSVAQETSVTTRPEILFVCVHNAGRSQMAAALLEHHGGEQVVVRSAGSVPAKQVNPVAVEVMAEIGLSLAGAIPRGLSPEVVQASDVVITMGCGDACPVYPGIRYLDWQLDDPAGQPVEVVRRIRDEIDTRVRALLADLGVAVADG